ncbi:MAG TPA: hypothetical protein VF088_16385 [Pyrinomonadaceae bacterium]
MRILRLISCASIVMTICVAYATAQETIPPTVKAAENNKPEYVLQVSRREGCIVFPISPKNKTGSIVRALFRPAQTPPDIATRPSKLFVWARQDGEYWQIKVSIGTGEFYDAGDVKIGEFKLSLNQRTDVPGVSQFGLSPIQVGVLKIVRQQAGKPEFRSLAESISLESMEVSELPDPFKLTLKNNSTQNLIAIQYNTLGLNRFFELKWLSLGLLDEPLIKAGKSYKLVVNSEDNSCGDDEGYHPNQTNRIDLVSAVFADGTHEGEPGLAALIKGKALGNRKNLERVVNSIRSLNDPAELSQQLNYLQEGMNEEAEPYLVDTLRVMLPTLPADATDGIISFIRSGMHEVKVSLLADAQHFKQLSERNNPELSKQWVERTKAKYERWWAAAVDMTSR